jgi:hypothetical protein
MTVEVKCSYETSVDSQRTTRRYIIQDRTFNISSSLKLRVSDSYKLIFLYKLIPTGILKISNRRAATVPRSQSALNRFVSHHHQLQVETQAHSVSAGILLSSSGSSHLSISWRFIPHNSVGYPVMFYS